RYGRFVHVGGRGEEFVGGVHGGSFGDSVYARYINGGPFPADFQQFPRHALRQPANRPSPRTGIESARCGQQ
ncbi:hypothetical protein, partial [Zoogloea sp. LCSB751]|uniref:hypothetical protein n=1 Tax=Zoogloea sp. LCSB751 TaxID=1965277 RepID=UPI001C1F78A1